MSSFSAGRKNIPRLVRCSATTSWPVVGSTTVEGWSRGRASSISCAHSSAPSTSVSTAIAGWVARATTRTTRSAVRMREPGGSRGAPVT